MALVLNRDFQIHKDVNGYPSYLRTLLVPGPLVILSANIEQTFTVPNDSNLVIFSKDAGNTLFVLIDDGSGSIVLPAPGSFIDNSLVDINVVGVTVKAGQTVHVMAQVETNLKINFYYDKTIQ